MCIFFNFSVLAHQGEINKLFSHCFTPIRRLNNLMGTDRFLKHNQQEVKDKQASQGNNHPPGKSQSGLIQELQEEKHKQVLPEMNNQDSLAEANNNTYPLWVTTAGGLYQLLHHRSKEQAKRSVFMLIQRSLHRTHIAQNS